MIKDENEIIVYVLSRINYGDSVNSDYILDFRLKKDYDLYQRAFGRNQEDTEGVVSNFENPDEIPFRLSITPSLIRLNNVPPRESGSRFREYSFYRLNMQALKEAAFISLHGIGLFIGEYDFQGRLFSDNQMPLLPKLHALSSDDLKVIPNPANQNYLPSKRPNIFTIQVRDVGQGNWNEVLCDAKYDIIYDIGTSIYASEDDFRNLISSRYAFYKHSKPVLVLSHWDADHINCLSVFSQKELRECFSKVFCMNQIKSMLAHQIYENLSKAFQKDLFCFEPYKKQTSDGERRLELNNYASIYIGRESRNINYSGMSLFIKGKDGSANLTGDIKLIQAYDAFQEERKRNLKLPNHILVAPHHGGRYSTGKKVYADPTRQVAISVGSRNHYGHPEESMLQLYEKISYGNVHRTDLHKEYKFDFS